MLTLGAIIKPTEAAKRERQRAEGCGGTEDRRWVSKKPLPSRFPQPSPAPTHSAALALVCCLSVAGPVFRNNHTGGARSGEAVRYIRQSFRKGSFERRARTGALENEHNSMC